MSLELGLIGSDFHGTAPHAEALPQAKKDRFLGGLVQSVSGFFGRRNQETQPIQPEPSPIEITQTHLTATRDNYSDIARRGQTIEFLDEDVEASVNSYTFLTDTLTSAESGAHFLSEVTTKNGLTKLTLNQEGKDVATHLVDTFYSELVDPTESDVQGLFSDRLKLMYQAIKQDAEQTGINTDVVRRIFTSARGQFEKRMKALTIEMPPEPFVATATIKPKKRRGFEVGAFASSLVAGLGLMAHSIMGHYAQAEANRLPTQAEIAAATPITRSIDVYRDLDPTPDSRLDPNIIKPAKLGSENPLAQLLPSGVAENGRQFSMEFFKGQDRNETKTAYIERKFNWEEFVQYVQEKEAAGQRFAPETLDGLFMISVDDGVVILGHSRNGDQNGPFEPIQDALNAGISVVGEEIPWHFDNGTVGRVRITSEMPLGYDEEKGAHLASPYFYPQMVAEDGIVAITCHKDTSGDGETDVYTKLGLEIVADQDIIPESALDFLHPKGAPASWQY